MAFHITSGSYIFESVQLNPLIGSLEARQCQLHTTNNTRRTSKLSIFISIIILFLYSVDTPFEHSVCLHFSSVYIYFLYMQYIPQSTSTSPNIIITDYRYCYYEQCDVMKMTAYCFRSHNAQ